MSVVTRWRARLAARKTLLAAARRRHAIRPTAASRATVELRKTQVAQAERVIRRHTPPKLTETVAFDGTPMFRGHALMLDDARRNGWGGKVNSADRREGTAERYGRLSQAALYAGWIAHRAGFNPANPPGRSTHELRSDAVAYRGPVGRPLSWWQLGLDCSEAAELRTVLNRLGYAAFRPYPDGREVHHVNLRRSPTARLRTRGLA